MIAFRVALATASAALGQAFSIRPSGNLNPEWRRFRITTRGCSNVYGSNFTSSSTLSYGVPARLRCSSRHSRLLLSQPPRTMRIASDFLAESDRAKDKSLSGSGSKSLGRSISSATGCRRSRLSEMRSSREGADHRTPTLAASEYFADDELNDSQREAVNAAVGPIRVVAGPGSGKTRVLTQRIAHLIDKVGAPPWSILAVTFTKKASEEMRHRVRRSMGEEVSSQVALGTFHSICGRILRRHGDALPSVVPGLDSRFSIFDTEDSRRLLTDILDNPSTGPKTKFEVKPAQMRSTISKLKSQGIRPRDMAIDEKGLTAGQIRYRRMVADVYKQYQERLVQSNAVDFDDLILVSLQLLKQDEGVFRDVGRRYRHILVDEWQDTNGPQYDLVLQLARAGLEGQFARENSWRIADAATDEAEAEEYGGGFDIEEAIREGEGEGEASASSEMRSLESKARSATAEASLPPSAPATMPPPSIFVVGDSDQCIYRFRGADYTNVARFVKDFTDCHTILLRENYRSSANIARAATAVIERVQERVKQSTVAVQGDGLPIGLMTCSDSAGEANAIASQLELYWTSGRVAPSEMAVMYRTNAQSRSFEEACLKRALPFVVVGAQRFYERREVKDCLVYLRLAANPRDAMAMRRAINTPARGIGAKTELALETLAVSAGSVPQLEAITVSECLMALLDPSDLDDLEAALMGSAADIGGGRYSIEGETFEKSDRVVDGEEFTRSGVSEGSAMLRAQAAAAAVPGNGGQNEEGWKAFSVQRARMLQDAIASGDSGVEVPKKGQANKLKLFAQILCRLRVVAATQGVPEVLRAVLDETGMERHVKETLATTGKAEGEDRWQNVLELERAASNPKFGGVAGAGALDLFLNEVSLIGGGDVEQERKIREEEEQAAAAAAERGENTAAPMAAKPPMIQLMTVHASKGLEFDTVFLAGLEKGTFPMSRIDESEMDEERRLLYVGMTRAKARLFLSWRKERLVFTPKGARVEESDPSPFLEDIPRDLIRTIDKSTPGHVPGWSSRGSGGSDRGVRVGGAGGGGRTPHGAAANRSKGDSRPGSAEPRRSKPDALDVTTAMFSDISPETLRRAGASPPNRYARYGGGGGGSGRDGDGGYGSMYSGGGRGDRFSSNSGRGSGRHTGRGRGRASFDGGGGGGGRDGGPSRESDETRERRRLQQQVRDEAEKTRYPVRALRDGGARLAKDSGEGIDTSWAAKLRESTHGGQGLPSGVRVGAQVYHAVHGAGQVVALVDGSDGVNVRFESEGEPFVTRVLGSKLRAFH